MFWRHKYEGFCFLFVSGNEILPKAEFFEDSGSFLPITEITSTTAISQPDDTLLHVGRQIG